MPGGGGFTVSGVAGGAVWVWAATPPASKKAQSASAEAALSAVFMAVPQSHRELYTPHDLRKGVRCGSAKDKQQ
jgi:hypothetical protein